MSEGALPTVRLGRSELWISRVGLGGWAFGGNGWVAGWGEQDPRDTAETVRYAARRGVNWVDVAPVYGLGHAEEVVGGALRSMPAADRPYVFTKCGLVWGAEAAGPTGGRIGRPDSIARQLRDSLRRLRVEQIDLYQMHFPAADGTRLEEYWSCLADLRRDGLVRAIGLSNHGVDELARAHRVAPVDACQPPFSVLRRDAADVVAWCRGNGVGVIAYSPLESGLLTGAFDEARVRALPHDDWRRTDPRFGADRLRVAADLCAAFAAVAARRRTTVSAVAVAWVLGWDGVTGATVGARRPDQVDGWRDAPGVILDQAELSAIEDIVHRQGCRAGPAHPSWRGQPEGEGGSRRESRVPRPADR